jgi:protein arginine N-methyltransferase 5
MRCQAIVILKPRYLTDNYQDHMSYICEYLFKSHDKLDKDEQAEVNYRNYLQSPLQPLADNLESATYETFENDSIKYELYEESMYKAMLDKKNFGKFFQTKNSKGP